MDVSIFDKNEIEQARRTLLNGLQAKRSVRSGRDADRNIVYEVIDDARTQQEAAALILSYAFGRPIQRSQVQVAYANPDSRPITRKDILNTLGKDPRALVSIAESIVRATQGSPIIEAETVQPDATGERKPTETDAQPWQATRSQPGAYLPYVSAHQNQSSGILRP